MPRHSGPCNSFNCLRHFKNVYDDGDDDDDLGKAYGGNRMPGGK